MVMGLLNCRQGLMRHNGVKLCRNPGSGVAPHCAEQWPQEPTQLASDALAECMLSHISAVLCIKPQLNAVIIQGPKQFGFQAYAEALMSTDPKLWHCSCKIAQPEILVTSHISSCLATRSS